MYFERHNFNHLGRKRWSQTPKGKHTVSLCNMLKVCMGFLWWFVLQFQFTSKTYTLFKQIHSHWFRVQMPRYVIVFSFIKIYAWNIFWFNYCQFLFHFLLYSYTIIIKQNESNKVEFHFGVSKSQGKWSTANKGWMRQSYRKSSHNKEKLTWYWNFIFFHFWFNILAFA